MVQGMAELGAVSLPVKVTVKGFKALLASIEAQSLLLQALSEAFAGLRDDLGRLDGKVVEMTEALSSRLDRISEDQTTLLGQVSDLQTANGELQTALNDALGDQGQAVQAAVTAAIAEQQATFNESLNALTEKAAEIDARVANASDEVNPGPTQPEEPTPPAPPTEPTPDEPAPTEPTPDQPAPTDPGTEVPPDGTPPPSQV
jgi:hypothetical protein